MSQRGLCTDYHWPRCHAIILQAKNCSVCSTPQGRRTTAIGGCWHGLASAIFYRQLPSCLYWNKTVRSLWICCDYKVTVNRVARTDLFPLPPIDNFFCIPGRREDFHKLDLAYAYLQLQLDEASKKPTDSGWWFNQSSLRLWLMSLLFTRSSLRPWLMTLLILLKFTMNSHLRPWQVTYFAQLPQYPRHKREQLADILSLSFISLLLVRGREFQLKNTEILITVQRYKLLLSFLYTLYCSFHFIWCAYPTVMRLCAILVRWLLVQ